MQKPYESSLNGAVLIKSEQCVDIMIPDDSW